MILGGFGRHFFSGGNRRRILSGMPSSQPMEFTGFSEAGFRLLKKLKKNNDRDWFREHKEEYQELVEQPMAGLVLAVARECRTRQVPLYAKEKNPVMRVYRDVRFSKDKTPYKTHVAAELRRSFSQSQMMLYLHFSPEESFAAAGVWQPERPLLHAWREEMVRMPERFTEMVAELEGKKLAVSREHSLVTMPRGFQGHADEPVGPWLKLTSFVTSRPFPQEECLQADLVEKVGEFAAAVRPLLEFGWKVEGARPKATVLR